MVPDFLFQGNPAGFGTTTAAEHPEPGLLAPGVFAFLVNKL